MEILKSILVLAFLAVINCNDQIQQPQQQNQQQQEQQQQENMQDKKSHSKRGSEMHAGTGYQTGFTPIYTPSYSSLGQVYQAAAASPQIYYAKVPQVQAAYNSLQFAPSGQKFAYAGPQITYTPQSASKINYATPVVYPQVQLAYPQSQHATQQPSASHQHQQQPQLQQQPQQQSHQTVPQNVPHVGPLAHQHSYAFAPMHAISLAYSQPSLQNQGIITHTQAIPVASNHILQHAVPTTSQTAIAPLQLVYPNIASTLASKSVASNYPTFNDITYYQPQSNHLQQTQHQTHLQSQLNQQQPQTFSYAIQPSIQVASAKQVLTPVPTVPTTYSKPVIAAGSTQTTHSNHGAVSYSSFQQHLGGHATAQQQQQPSTTNTIKIAQIAAPQYYTAAAAAPVQQVHSQTYGKAFAYAAPVAQASGAPAFYAVAPTDGLNFGTQLFQPTGLQRLNYGVATQKFLYPGH